MKIPLRHFSFSLASVLIIKGKQTENKWKSSNNYFSFHAQIYSFKANEILGIWIKKMTANIFASTGILINMKNWNITGDNWAEFSYVTTRYEENV